MSAPEIALPSIDPENVKRLLPLARCTSSSTLLGRQNSLVMFYADRIVSGTTRQLESLHPVVDDPEAVAKLLSHRRVIPLDGDTRITLYPGGRRKRHATMNVKGKRSAEFKLPHDQTEHLVAWLSAQLGDRISISQKVPIHAWGMWFFSIALLATASAIAILGGRDFVVLASSTFFLFLIVFWLVAWDHLSLVHPWLVTTKGKGKKNQVDLSRRKPFRSLLLGWTMKIICAAILLCRFFVPAIIQIPLFNIARQFTAMNGADAIVVLALDVILSLLCLLGIYYGHRLAQRKPNYCKLEDSRKPIVYLRSFLDDRKQTLVAPSRWAIASGVRPPDYLPSPWKYVLLANPIRVIRILFDFSADTSEEQLALHFRDQGPFVAIGQPGERFVSPGAQRMYVTNDEWKQVVIELVNDSQAIVLQPSSTEGVWWEIEKVFQSTDPRKILLCLVNFHLRQDEYETFRLRASEVIGDALPKLGGLTSSPAFLFFDGEKQPVMRSTCYRTPLLWSVLGNPVDLKTTLDGFLSMKELKSSSLPWTDVRPKGYSFRLNTVASIAHVSVAFLIGFLWSSTRPATDDQNQSAQKSAQMQAAALGAPGKETQTGVLVTPNNELQTVLNEADNALASNNMELFSGKVRRALEIAPDDAAAQFLEAILLDRQGQTTKALDVMKQIVAKQPNVSYFLGFLGNLQLQTGEVAESIESYLKASRIAPDVPMFLVNAGLGMKKLGHYEDAVKQADIAIKIAGPHIPVALQMAFDSLLELDRPSDALPYSNSWIELAPNDAKAHASRAQALLKLSLKPLKDAQKAASLARESFEKAITISPETIDYQLDRARAILAEGKTEEAMQELAKVREKFPDQPIVPYEIAMIQRRMADYKGAIESLAATAKFAPDNTDLTVQLLAINVAIGNWKAAAGQLQTIIKQNPDEPVFQLQKELIRYHAIGPSAFAPNRAKLVTQLTATKRRNANFLAVVIALTYPSNPELVKSAGEIVKLLREEEPAVALFQTLEAECLARVGDKERAEKIWSSIDVSQLTDIGKNLHLLLSLASTDQSTWTDMQKQRWEECSNWFRTNCPAHFQEGQIESMPDDWTTRMLMGVLFETTSRNFKLAVPTPTS